MTIARGRYRAGRRVQILLCLAAFSLLAQSALAIVPADVNEINRYLKSLPDAAAPPLNEAQALTLAAMPLSCLDHPQSVPEQRVDYLWVPDAKPRLVEGYDKHRAFYGCYDWHSAVNSTWTLVVLLKQFPDLSLARLIREKLDDHLGKSNVEGEMAFFKDAKRFEMPYGYAWLLKLYGEFQTWDDPDAKKWAANLAPLVAQFSAKLKETLPDDPYATRAGVHGNTALSLDLMLDYTDAAGDKALDKVVRAAALRYFSADRDCPTAYEPGGAEFLSPCLAEAKLMSRVLDQHAFVAWFDSFLPPVYSAAFKPLTVPVDVSGITKKELLAGKSHLIGLAFQRAESMLAIAAALPANDPRIPVLRRVASINASSGFRSLAGAGYLGSHWLGTYAVLYERAAGKSPAQPVEKTASNSPAK